MGSFSQLKQRQRAERDGWQSDVKLRIHRALSWLQRAEQCDDDLDGEFIFLWIAFNAAYAHDMDGYQLSESETFNEFLRLLCHYDGEQQLHQLVWKKFSSSIRILLNNQYVFAPFWYSQQQGDDAWKAEFDKANNAASRALGQGDTAKVLAIAFSRLYTLRNQLVHGGATWNSQVNRAQLRDGCDMLRALVPVIITIMMDQGKGHWGKAHYPVVD